MNTANWIWADKEPSLEKSVCLLRKTFSLETPPQTCPLRVSADSVYRLYVNGAVVARGPQKSDRYRRYYDTLDIAAHLRPGKNVVAAFVCHFVPDEEGSRIFETGPISVLCELRAGFWLACETLGLFTDRSWLVLPTHSYRFRSPYLSRYATDMLDVSLGEYPQDFAQPDFDDADFQRAVVVCDTEFERCGGITTWPLAPANLPRMEETPIAPRAIARSTLPGAQSLLAGESLVVPPGTAGFVELDMGELTTAHVELRLRYGSDKPAFVRLSYAESYFRLNERGELFKGVRDETENAIFDGEEDRLQLRAEYGCAKEMKFETVFFRTFRFLRIEVAEARAPIALYGLKFVKTLYPLQVRARCEAPASARALWDISVRTLRLCMHSTYEDCPYYEQMQYTMDTAIQMKYTYCLSTDDRLARNAIDAFSAARMPDGLVPCTAPAKFCQVIPGFALYYIEMLYDHYWNFADDKLLKRYFCVADSILQYFAAKVDERTGLFPRSQYWEFVDWVQQWHHNFGVPISKEEKVHTIYHEMFVYFLRRAAFLCDCLARVDMAREYRALAQRVSEGVRQYCYDAQRGFFLDTPQRRDASVHAQIWAVLAEIVSGQEARELMERTLADETLFQCSYSMTYYYLRALEMTGLYGRGEERWESWRTMMRLHMTTWSEDPVTQRSDCHGWSSLPIYEFCRATLGVTALRPGYAAIRIAPYTEKENSAEGIVACILGDISVKWWKEGGKLHLVARTPVGVPVEVALGGQTWTLDGGDIQVCTEETKA